MLDLLVKGATIVTDGVEFRADLGVSNGRVSHLGSLSEDSASEVIDASGKVLLPGFVELAVSPLEDAPYAPAAPGQDLAALTAQAALGGVTSLIVARAWNASRPFADELAEVRERDAARAAVDFGYHYFISDWSADRRRHLRLALTAGVPSVWIPRAGVEAAPAAALHYAVLRDLPANCLAVTTLSDPGLEAFLRSELKANGQLAAAHHGAIFPEWLETEALRRLDAVARGARARLLVAGLTCPRSLAEFAALRDANGVLCGAASLAHLCFNLDQMEEETTPRLPFAWPPLRPRSAQQALWNALDDGLLQVATSLHRPVAASAYAASLKDASTALDGSSALPHFAPMLYGEGAAKLRMGTESLSLCACADPAKLAGIYPRKGTLQIGADADFLIFDPNADHVRPGIPAKLGPETHDAFAGLECAGALEGVFLRGESIAGEMSSAATPHPPSGRFLDRQMAVK
ncbi:MAG: amidohydrolase family protein [Sumerlaeia bacterium]